jgi:hypothetical protein
VATEDHVGTSLAEQPVGAHAPLAYIWIGRAGRPEIQVVPARPAVHAVPAFARPDGVVASQRRNDVTTGCAANDVIP